MRLFSRSLIAPMIVFLGALALRIADPSPIVALRNLVFDHFQRWAPRPYQDAGIRIVDIDDESLARMGQWPWPRTEIAVLLDRLHGLGAAAVVLDIIFAESDRTSPKNILPIWRQSATSPLPPDLAKALPDHDEVLAQQIASAPTVLGIVLVNEGGTRPRPLWGLAAAGADVGPALVTFNGALENLPVLETHAAGLGVLNAVPDRDGVIRTAPLLFALNDGGKYPALSVEALRVASRASTYLVQGAGASGFSAFGQNVGMNGIRVGAVSIPTDAKGRIAIYDTGPEPGRTIPAWQVLAGKVDPSAVADRVVFVGTSAVGLGDLRVTPLRPLVPGIEVHAQIAEQIRLGIFLQRPNWITGAELCWMTAMFALLLWSLGRAGPIWAALFGSAAVSVSMGLSWVAFRRFGLLIDPVYPALAAVALYLTQSLRQFIRTENDRRYLKGAFGRYISPALLDQLAQDSSRLRLGGEMREMTIMFCDIRGFTSLAETMDAEALTHFVNGFFTPMTECVLGCQGTIDKYIGDCLMAFWNAPLPEPRHAEFAVRAALDMANTLGPLNSQWRSEAEAAGREFSPIGIGIGIATGPCCVGNLGSEQRFDYSVLGDDVNLASRLEGQTKVYHLPIVISEATQAKIPEFATLELDLLRVKGKQRPSRIFTVLGDEKVAAENWFVALASEHRAMLEEFRSRKWEEAATRVDRLLSIAPESVRDFYRFYGARIEQYSTTAPLEWDGVVVAENK